MKNPKETFIGKTVVHCTTKKEIDFVTNKLKYTWSETSFEHMIKCLPNCGIEIDKNCYSDIDYFKNNNYFIISLHEFCAKLEIGNPFIKILPNSATSPKKVEDLKYPDVIHIENEEDYNKIINSNIKLNPYIRDRKYYLAGGVGLSRSRSSYENHNYQGGTYTIYEMNQIIFPEEPVNEKFEVGKWYKVEWEYSPLHSKKIIYIKPNCVYHQTIDCSGSNNMINDNNQVYKGYVYLLKDLNILKSDCLAEIQQFLPDDHPDKIRANTDNNLTSDHQFEFSAGEYVVLEHGCSTKENWRSSLPSDYVYKLRAYCNPFEFLVELDLKNSNTNGWRVIVGKYHSKLKVRLANPFEKEAYIIKGKPVPVDKCKDILFEEACKRYSVGSKFKIVHMPYQIETVLDHSKYENTFVEGKDGTYALNLKVLNHFKYHELASVWYNGKWAEIIEEKQTIKKPFHIKYEPITEEQFDELTKQLIIEWGAPIDYCGFEFTLDYFKKEGFIVCRNYDHKDCIRVDNNPQGTQERSIWEFIDEEESLIPHKLMRNNSNHNQSTPNFSKYVFQRMLDQIESSISEKVLTNTHLISKKKIKLLDTSVSLQESVNINIITNKNKTK